MSERTTVTQVTNIGVESTSGTAVTCDKRLQALSIAPSINPEVAMFGPAGEKFSTVQALNAEWVTAQLSGQPTFTEIVYPLSSAMSAAAITTPGGGTDAREWAFEIDPTALSTPETFTVESGDSVRAHRFAYGIVDSLNLEFSRRNGVSLGGSMLAQAIDDGVTLESSPTAIDLVPVLGSQLDVYVDDASGDLGTTKLTRNFRARLNIGNRFGAIWPMDSSKGSFAATVELKPTVTLELQVEADSDGMGFLSTMRTGATKFVRIAAVGAEIETDQDYEMRFDFAGKVSGAGNFEDADGVWAMNWTFDAVHDADWGAALQALVRNDLTAL
ncbi:MAG: hypothetical protein S0880_13100 [Actinomycetota bacterium]|nr:hypothetical protein [Actinomycetota bacterium]